MTAFVRSRPPDSAAAAHSPADWNPFDIATCAWADARLGEGDGCLSLDLRHKAFAGERHSWLARGRDNLDAAPVRAVRQGSGGERMDVAVAAATFAHE